MTPSMKDWREIRELRVDADKYEGITMWADDATATPGGAPSSYTFDLGDGASGGIVSLEINFQTRPYTYDNGANGVTNEALLCIVLDRLRAFQKGPGACRENAIAITSIEEALLRLQARSRRLVDERRSTIIKETVVERQDAIPAAEIQHFSV